MIALAIAIGVVGVLMLLMFLRVLQLQRREVDEFQRRLDEWQAFTATIHNGHKSDESADSRNESLWRRR
jgi:hypothetical protein